MHTDAFESALAEAESLVDAASDCREFVHLRAMAKERLGDLQGSFDDFSAASHIASQRSADRSEVHAIAQAFLDKLCERRVADAVSLLGLNGGYADTLNADVGFFKTRALGVDLTVAYAVVDRVPQLGSIIDWEKQVAEYVRDAVDVGTTGLVLPATDVHISLPYAAIRIERDAVYAHLRAVLLTRAKSNWGDVRQPMWQSLVVSAREKLPVRLGEMHQVVEDLVSQTKYQRKISSEQLPSESYSVESGGRAGDEFLKYRLVVKSKSGLRPHSYSHLVRDDGDHVLHALFDDEPLPGQVIRSVFFVERVPAYVRRAVRDGWPRLVDPSEFTESRLKQSSGRLAKVLNLDTGLEEEVEKAAEAPFERLFLLALSLQQQDPSPAKFSLDQPLGSLTGPPFDQPQYALDVLDVTEAVLLCEAALGITVDDDPYDESDLPSVREMARILKRAAVGNEHQKGDHRGG